MPTKFKSYSNHIEQVEIQRETDSCVWISDRKSFKVTSYECYHDTFEQAKARLVTEAKEDLERAKRQLEYAQSKLAEANAVKLTAPR